MFNPKKEVFEKLKELEDVTVSQGSQTFLIPYRQLHLTFRTIL